MFLRAHPCSSLQTACFVPWKKALKFYGQLSVRITWFDSYYNETYDTILELEKIGRREGHYRKGKVSSAMLPQP